MISMSIILLSGSSALDSAIASADSAGIPVVVAAGNINENACNVSPARAPSAITVGATNVDDELWYASSWGSCVNILAPGADILSASHQSDTGTLIDSGTSMATPLVSGVVAKYMSANPNASTSQVKSFLTSTATQNTINLRGTNGTPNVLLYSSC